MKKILLLAVALLTFASCELVDVLNQEPMYKLDLTTSITSPEMAELALVGTYAQLSGTSMNYLFITLSGSFQSGAMLRQSYITSGNSVYLSERFLPILSYSTFGDKEFANDYQIIKNGIFLLKALENIPESAFASGRKATMIGEIHFLSALAYFRLLIQFGEYWDMNSIYGMVIRDQIPSIAGADKARATVAQTYEEIMRHLDIAIAQAPEYSTSTVASKQAARALKAKILFFQGDWPNAATAAAAAITSANPLEGNYGDVFSKAETSKEIIFARGFGTTDVTNTTGSVASALNTANWGPTTEYMNIINGDPRQQYVVWTRDGIVYQGVTHNNVHTVRKLYRAGGVVPMIFMRTAELYLIRAEALARSNASIADAWAPVVTLRNRAGNTNITVPATRQELMDKIFREWWIELAFENWHEWFAVLRFDNLLQMNSSLETQRQQEAAKGPEFEANWFRDLEAKRIYRIPNGEISSNKLMEQNPGY